PDATGPPAVVTTSLSEWIVNVSCAWLSASTELSTTNEHRYESPISRGLTHAFEDPIPCWGFSVGDATAATPHAARRPAIANTAITTRRVARATSRRVACVMNTRPSLLGDTTMAPKSRNRSLPLGSLPGTHGPHSLRSIPYLTSLTPSAYPRLPH